MRASVWLHDGRKRSGADARRPLCPPPAPRPAHRTGLPFASAGTGGRATGEGQVARTCRTVARCGAVACDRRLGRSAAFAESNGQRAPIAMPTEDRTPCPLPDVIAREKMQTICRKRACGSHPPNLRFGGRKVPGLPDFLRTRIKNPRAHCGLADGLDGGGRAAPSRPFDATQLQAAIFRRAQARSLHREAK